MKSLIQKKGQQEIIVTVLLVLVALVAVGAVVMFVSQLVNKNISTAKGKASCLDVSFTIEKVTNDTLSITRGGDSINVSKLNIYIGGKLNKTLNASDIPNPIETKTINITAKVGDKVGVNPIIGDFICENSAEAVIA
jgi:flagellin-like protein